MSEPQRIYSIDAEVLSVTTGMVEATGQPVVVLTLRPITNTGWRHVNHLLHPENAHTVLERLTCVGTGMTVSSFITA